MTDVTYQNGWPVPAGWKLVPVEPTYELECEVGGVRMDEESFLYEYADHEKIGEICRAVVKYSPPPPKAPDYNPGPLEVSVIGMPEFDALLDHIYEEGTSSEGVIHLANKLVRAAIQSHMQHTRNTEAPMIAINYRRPTMKTDDPAPFDEIVDICAEKILNQLLRGDMRDGVVDAVHVVIGWQRQIREQQEGGHEK